MSVRLASRFVLVAASFVALCVTAAAYTPAAAQPAPSPSPGDAVTRAQGLLRVGKFKEAIAVLDTQLEKNPRDALALVLRGDAESDLGDNQAALKDYNAAIGISPDFQYAYVTRCETRLALDDQNGALEDCNKAIELDPNDGQAYQDRGDVYFDRGAYDLSLADYDKAIELGRHGAYVYAARCDANRVLEKVDAAQSDCDRAMTIDPKSRQALWSNARLDIARGKYSEAIGDLNTYIAQDPNDSNLGYYFRGLSYNRSSSYRNALDDLEIYVKRVPRDGDGYRERAIARFGLGDKTGALADCDAAYQAYSKDGDTAAADKVTALANAMRSGAPLPKL